MRPLRRWHAASERQLLGELRNGKAKRASSSFTNTDPGLRGHACALASWTVAALAEVNTTS
jgi:hypothetical protein